MKVAAAITSFAAIAFAAPAPAPKDNAIEARRDYIKYPLATFRYFVNSQKTIEDPQDQMLVVKNGVADDESTAIVTFKFDEHSEGRKCELLFDLFYRDHSTGTQDLDVFSVIDPPQSTFTVSNIADIRPASSRDQHRGRIHAPRPGSAKWTQSYNGYPQFDCPPAGEIMGVEYVGVGDAVQVRWDIGVSGPRVRVL